MPMIEVDQLRKTFGVVEAVSGISFSVNSGEVVGFLGPNGAGKSTTMKMITGYLPPTGGAIRIGGIDVAGDPIGGKRQVGYLPEGAPLYGEMTPRALLEFTAAIRQMSREKRAARIAYVVGALELEPVLLRRIETLSKGYKRRVALAQAVLHDPEVLILDEPTDGLDPNQKHQVRDLIRQMGQSKAIIISTHLLEEVDAVCDRALIIDQGRIVLEGTPEKLHAHTPTHNAVVLRVPPERLAEARERLQKLEGVGTMEIRREAAGAESLWMTSRDGAAFAARASAVLAESGIPVLALRTEEGRLDEVFRAVTAGGRQGRE